MAEGNTFDRIVAILREQDGLEGVELTPETRLADVGLDSLATIEAVMACEDEFDIEIDAESNPQTVGEFITLVDGLLAEK
ncbi:MAG: acyl carrier protein [Atopobium sp.]|jgi:acyl carrier protein|nr:acyl carrier protein [Atopobium sp.]